MKFNYSSQEVAVARDQARQENSTSGVSSSLGGGKFGVSKLVLKNLGWKPESYPVDHPLAPINKHLCRACRRIFEGTGRESINLLGTDNNGAFLEHLDGYFIQKSARAGCAMCAIVWSSHSHAAEQLAKGEEVPFRYDFGWFSGGGDLNLFAIKFYPYSLLTFKNQLFPLMMPTITLTLDPRNGTLGGNTSTTATEKVGQMEPSRSRASIQGTTSTGSPESIQQIRAWLERSAHLEEGQTAASAIKATYIPHRLVEVDGGCTNTVRVVDGGACPPTSQYLTLSHCWGEKMVYRLLSSNIEESMRAISLDTLPKTFSEAVTVSRLLGLRYIWIDSLCIIQDSLEDWERNAAVMWKVYRYSHLTLAASASGDSSGGLFRTRLAATVLPCLVHVPERHPHFKTGTYEVYDEDEMNESVHTTRLNSRAWVLQERVLSPRIVHFTDTQLYFECLDFRASERFPERLPDRMGSQWLRDTLLRNTLIDEGYLMGLWSGIVAHYTTLELTYTSDKMAAVSAISKQVSRLTSNGCRYVAGLWESSLPGQLCWKSTTNTKRATDRKAPSWSWASMDGPIKPSFRNINDTNKALVTFSTSGLTYSRDPFISFPEGLLRLSAPCLRVNLASEKKSKGKSNTESLTERRSRVMKMLPGPTTDSDFRSLAFSSRAGLPTGPSGSNIFDMDISNATMVRYQEDGNIETSIKDESPRRNFQMDWGGKFLKGEIFMDDDFETQALKELHPIFVPIFCCQDGRLRWEVDLLKGLILVGTEDPGVFRRIGVGELGECDLAEFLCAMGNQEHSEPEKVGLPQADRLTLEAFVPEMWSGKGLEFIPKDYACYDFYIT